MTTLRERIEPIATSNEYLEFTELWYRLQEESRLAWEPGNRLMTLGRGLRSQIREVKSSHFRDQIQRRPIGPINPDVLEITESIRVQTDDVVRVVLPALAEYGDWVERLLRGEPAAVEA